VTQARNMYGTENAAIYVDRAARSKLMTDSSDRSMWMAEFSVSYMFQACVTLGFFKQYLSLCITRFGKFLNTPLWLWSMALI
jgi:hypothetical protein